MTKKKNIKSIDSALGYLADFNKAALRALFDLLCVGG